MKKILFLHGFFASGQCVPALALQDAFSRPCGHTPTAEEVCTWYVPIIEKMLMEHPKIIPITRWSDIIKLK